MLGSEMKLLPAFNFQRLSDRRAFSLSELLVAVGIVGILAAFLMGAAQVVGNSGSSAKCAANLRNIGIAFAGYVSDHRKELPPMSALRDPSNSASDVLMGQDALLAYLSMPSNFNWKQNSDSPSPFGPWICPADRADRPSKILPHLPRWKALNSYLLNYYVGKGAVTAAGTNVSSRTVLRITEIANPQSVWYYADGIRLDGGQGRMTEGIVNALEDSAASGVALRFRHGSRVQVLTVAGSVLSYTTEEVRGRGQQHTVPVKTGE